MQGSISLTKLMQHAVVTNKFAKKNQREHLDFLHFFSTNHASGVVMDLFKISKDKIIIHIYSSSTMRQFERDAKDTHQVLSVKFNFFSLMCFQFKTNHDSLTYSCLFFSMLYTKCPLA